MLINKELVGRRIVAVRHLEKREDIWGFLDERRGAFALELDDGAILVPSQDEEGNGPGDLFYSKGDVNGLVDPPEEKNG